MTTPLPMQYATTLDGVRIAHMSLGDRPPIVFASNIFGDLTGYRVGGPHVREVTDRLVQRGWRVIRYDVRGMGFSDRSVEDLGLAGRVLDLQAVVTQLRLDRFALAALDIGAATAVSYAIHTRPHVSCSSSRCAATTGARWAECIRRPFGAEAYCSRPRCCGCRSARPRFGRRLRDSSRHPELLRVESSGFHVTGAPHAVYSGGSVMRISSRRFEIVQTAIVVVALTPGSRAQRPAEPPVGKPVLSNPYRLDPDWPMLPATMKGPNGRKWGEVIRVHVAANGNVWVFHRCFHDKPAGDATCVNRGDNNPPILEFNAAGRLLRSMGVGLFAHPHGFTVDPQGNIWTTDTNDTATILGMPATDPQGAPLGQTVLKISPTGRVLMTIGKPGLGGQGPDLFNRPTGVAIGDNGTIFVADGHSPNTSNSARIVKFSPEGRFIKAWGRMGVEPGNFREPHDLYVGGSKRYVYVADRLNNRIQVFDQEGTFIAAWTQFGQPSSVFVDARDNIYVGATYQDPARGNVMRATTGPNDRAIVIGNAITGELKYLIPDPGDLSTMTDTGTSASGIGVDAAGNIYAADVGFNNLRKYVRVP